MSTFVLVHGAWHGGWCWQRVRRRLEARGHEVVSPSLSGLGERAHLDIAYDLNTHIDDIARLIEFEDLSDIVLCGHSYGGMVISGVCDVCPERLKALVYLDAMLPADGQCGLDIMAPGYAAQFRAEAEARGDHCTAPVPAANFGIEDPADQAWVDGLCRPMRLACFETKLADKGGRAQVANKLYLTAASHGGPHFRQTAARLSADPAWQVASFPCGHDVMVIMPDELTEWLLKAAG